MANHHYGTTLGAMAGNFQMHLGHQRTSGIKDAQVTLCRFRHNRPGYTVGAEDDSCAIRYLAQIGNEHCAFSSQIIDDIFVMHNFMPDINGRAKQIKRALNDSDGAFNASAKAARVSQQDVYESIPTISTVKRTLLPASG
jgi:hypothetical protein